MTAPTDAAAPAALSEQDVRHRIAGLDNATARRTVCDLVGHSRLPSGFAHCGRCGVLYPKGQRILYIVPGCYCGCCEAYRQRLTWRDTLLVPEAGGARELT